jgi:proton-dependent oligopeptide transporter, POT family
MSDSTATDSTATTIVVHPARAREFLGHPRGLGTLFFTEMWERFSYYGMRALLILFLTDALARGGLGFDDKSAGAVYGLYTAASYLCCLPGGWLADRLFGQRSSVFAGGVLIALGNLLLAVPAGVQLVYVGLLVIALGTGMLKPNVSCLVGELYKGESGSRRDSAFSIYYLGINLGAFIAPFVAGTIGETRGYRWGFFAASVAMALGVIQYRATGHWLGDAGLRPQAASDHERRRSWRMLVAGMVLLIAIVIALASGVVHLNVLEFASAAGILMGALAVVFFGGVLGFGGLSAAEKKRVVVIAVFFASSAIFWAGYEQAGSSLNLFARDQTDRSFLGSWFASGQHPVSWYQSFQSVFILLLAPVFAWGWLALGRRRRDPSAPAKLGWGLVQLGLSYLVMMVAAKLVFTSGHRVMPGWLITTYLLQTTGELCLSPIGLSNVTKLAPERFAGQMMGTWFLGTAVGDLFAGLLGGEVAAGSLTEMSTQFLHMALVGCAAGVVMLLFARPLRRWMGGAG